MTIVVIELHVDKMFVKFEGSNLKIVDVATLNAIEIPHTSSIAAGAFMFLFEIQRFLTFSSNNVVSYNFKGEVVNTFKIPTILASWTSVSVSSNQHFIFLHTNSILPLSSPKKDTNPEQAKNQGAIFVFGTLKGTLLCEITAPCCFPETRPSTPQEEMDSLFNEELFTLEVKESPEEKENIKLYRALNQLTTLHYDEESFELYAATSLGILSWWCT